MYDIVKDIFASLCWHRELTLLPLMVILMSVILVVRIERWHPALAFVPGVLLILFLLASMYIGFTAVASAMDIGSIYDPKAIFAATSVAAQIAIGALFGVAFLGMPENLSRSRGWL